MNVSFGRRSALAALGAVAVVSLSCGKEPAQLTPTAVATPTPAPTATPTPSPSPTASPAGLTCTVPPMSDCGASCCTRGGTPAFDSEIERAQAALRTSSPDLFNRDGSLAVDEVTYTSALARKITELFGLCARGGGPGTSISRDEVAVKRDNRMSQNVDVILGFNNSPHVGGVYTCRPASF